MSCRLIFSFVLVEGGIEEVRKRGREGGRKEGRKNVAEIERKRYPCCNCNYAL